MDKRQQHDELKQDETTISVTIHEASLLSNMIYVALLNMHSLDDNQRKVAKGFMIKLQKAALSISKQSLQSLR